MGEFTSARSHLERAISLYDSGHTDTYRAIYPVVDPGTTSLGWLAMALCLLGYPDKALEKSRQALELARKLAHPFNLVFTLGRSNQFHLLRREGEASLSTAEESLDRAIEYGFAQMSTWAAAHRGRALIELGRSEEGVVQLVENIAALRANGWQLQLTAFLGALGDGYLKTNRVADGFAAAAEGLDISEKNGDRWFDAELYRLKGELLLRQDAPAESNAAEEAQNCFHQALEIAVASRPNGGSCEQPRASRGCSRNRAAVTKRARCLQTSTAGSPRASIPPT
jgi:tetratricopeptide (TPR) repeat protein